MKVSDIKFHGYSSSRSRTDLCRHTARQTDRRDERNKRFSRLHERAEKREKKWNLIQFICYMQYVVHYCILAKSIGTLLLFSLNICHIEENRGAIWYTLRSLYLDLSLNFYCLRSNKSMYVPVWKEIMFHLTHSLVYILQRYTDPGGTAVAQLVEALPYKSEGRGFDSRWCHWNFPLT